MSKRNIAYTQQDEPAFLKRFKEKIGYKEAPGIDAKVITNRANRAYLCEIMCMLGDNTHQFGCFRSYSSYVLAPKPTFELELIVLFLKKI